MNNREQVAYKDLQVWQKSMDLVDQVIEVIDEMDTPRKHYRLIEQLESAATSIPLNIAEGKGRLSKKNYAIFIHSTRISL